MRELTVVRLSGLALLLLSVSAGCIVSREGQLPPITQWPPEAKTSKPSIGLMVSGKAFANGQEQDVPTTVLVHQWRVLTGRAYQESGLFSDVKFEAADTDLRAEINITDQGQHSKAMSYVSGFTMCLIPSSASDTITVSTTLKDRNGKTISVFQKQETSTLWMQLFLAFAMPFCSKQEPLVYDLNRATILEARAKGHL